MSSTTPRYKAIEAFLLERIHSGAYPVNHQIPPEEQLARDFGVSRMTANKAIRDLVQKGYLIRQAGWANIPICTLRLFPEPCLMKP